jgi:hypothetical protein
MKAQVYIDGKWVATFPNLEFAEEVFDLYLSIKKNQTKITITCDGERREWSHDEEMFVHGQASFTPLAERVMATRVRNTAGNEGMTLEGLAAKSDKELMGMVNLGKKGIAWIRANVKR